jgi:hypothetical protein
LEKSSNYVVSSNIKECLSNLPQDLPIFLHIDMDYFNNRFNGNSNWETENERIHDINPEDQRRQMHSIATELKKRRLCERVVDTCIGISAGFYPGEFWSLTEEFIGLLKEAGIKI